MADSDREELSWILWIQLGSEKDVPSDYYKYVDPLIEALQRDEELDQAFDRIEELESEVEGLNEIVESVRDALR